MTEPEVLKLVAVMTAALPREWSFLTKDQQKATERIYVRMFADLPYPAANAAVEALLATSTKMPTIAEVREATLSVMRGDVRAGGDAWGDVRKLAVYRNVGDVSDVDPIVLHVCKAMGWIAHRTIVRGGADVLQWHVALGENEAADRARFIELYDHHAHAQRREHNVSQLPAAQRYRALEAAQHTTDATRAVSGEQHRIDCARLLPQETETK